MSLFSKIPLGNQGQYRYSTVMHRTKTNAVVLAVARYLNQLIQLGKAKPQGAVEIAA